ncbi:MAG: NADH-ubiquinone oxidoreductase-F iron-sulfur binding region domain-containing protein [Candidatus Nanopelagicales bacterium]
MTTLFIPRDSAARSVGADEVAARLAALLPGSTVVRTGSRGALWLEPLVEVDTPEGRRGYGPVPPEDAESVAASVAAGTGHPLALGLVDDLPWLAGQHRLVFARCGLADPLDADAYVALGGLAALRSAVAMDPLAVVASVEAAGLRGRGGAGFPAGIKWRTVAAAEADRKYVCINADEGDSGTFADRLLMEGDPFSLIEGTVIAGLAVGATQGYAYIRSEYPDAVATMRAAVGVARDRGWIGPSVLGSGRAFDLAVRVGAGSYVCGEETAMLESLAGRRGMVRAKPPIPALAGLHGRPTLVHNVLTLASVVSILQGGPEQYAALGQGRSRGTQVFQLAGNIARGGIVELPFGPTLRDLVEGYGGGTLSGRPVRAVQLGGPLGAYLPPSRLDVAMDYESLAEAGGMLGHGGIVVFDDTVDMAEQARFAMEFCAEESCGKCTPCRIGAVRGVEVVDRLRAGADPDGDRAVLLDLCEVMRDGSLCAMGGLTPQPVLSALEHFGEDFAPRAAVSA